MNVVWSDEAEERLWEIEQYIAEDNPAAAVRLTDRLLERTLLLEHFPEMGRMVPEYGEPRLRELVEGNYRIFYVLRDDVIEVVTVFEGHRLPPSLDELLRE